MERQCHSERRIKEASAGTLPFPQSQGWVSRSVAALPLPSRSPGQLLVHGPGSQDSLPPAPKVTTGLTFSEAGGTQATALPGLGKR